MKEAIEKRFALIGMFSPNLALRDTADNLFDIIDKSKSEKVAVDFSKIRSITRSFAHQYLVRKNASRKVILEKNVPVDIEKMFSVVRHNQQKSRLVMLNKMKATPLKVDLSMYLF